MPALSDQNTINSPLIHKMAMTNDLGTSNNNTELVASLTQQTPAITLPNSGLVISSTTHKVLGDSGGGGGVSNNDNTDINPTTSVSGSGADSGAGASSGTETKLNKEQNDDDDEDYDDYESLPQNTSLAANLVAGAAAGIMEHTVMYPVDAIKTRMQVVTGAGNKYSGIVSAVTRISAAEGARSLWRGMTSVVIGAGPAHAVYFAVYESVKNSLGGNADKHHHPIVTSIAGASATTTSDALMNPFDVIKQRMQLRGAKYSGFFHCALDIYKKEGFGAFYVSYPTTLMMNIPFTAVNFTVYESASKFLNPNKVHDPLVHCVAGGIAGASAAAITTPLDVIKTLLQTKGLNYDVSVRQLNSFKDAASYIYKHDGLRGFWKGLRPRVVSNMPSTAISWTSYEMAKFYLYKSSHFATKKFD
ncbi:Mrs3p [Sugiyamaella lignohabitans]|uniref:Mrs3p n=1 Tax=Sugiyamaella lignohabitans TaxID=796027 RepID=A0A167D1K8_9ASCO|nr:Mrs3p [Sugiyamaella lignohabitans]ANB12366.1 Mrs3p [Sugiyamaella lignohabitans]